MSLLGNLLPHHHTHQEIHVHAELDLHIRSPIAVLEPYYHKLEKYHKQAHDFLETLTLQQKAEFSGIGRAWTQAQKELLRLTNTKMYHDPTFYRQQLDEILKITSWLQNQHPHTGIDQTQPLETVKYEPATAIPIPDFAQIVLPKTVSGVRVSVRGNLGGVLLNLGASIDLNFPVNFREQHPTVSLTTRKSGLLHGNISLGATAGVDGALLLFDPSHVEGGFVTFAVDIAPKDVGAGVAIHYAPEWPPRIVGATISGLVGFEISLGLTTSATVLLPILS